MNERERDRRLVQLLLRLLGVYFVIDGIISTLGNGIDLLDQARLVRAYELESVSVRRLSLNRTAVNDAGLAHLAGLESLESLHLDETDVTDAGLKHLAGLTKLRRLRLEGTEITGDGLRHIAELGRLEELFLGRAPVNDKGLTHAGRLVGLEGTQITDDGLEHLYRLRNLRMLRVPADRLPDTPGVTEEGLDRLQERLPDLRVFRIVSPAAND